MTIHRRMLRVPTKPTPNGIAPDLDLPSGVNMAVLEYEEGGTCVVECWLSDLTHDRVLLAGLHGDELRGHAKSPRIIGQVFVEDASLVDTQSKTVSIGGRSVPYRRQIPGKISPQYIVDEG